MEEDSSKRWIWYGSFALSMSAVVAVTVVTLTLAQTKSPKDTPCPPGTPLERANCLLQKTPIFDGHNDLPETLKTKCHNQLEIPLCDLSKDLTGNFNNNSQTDIPRMRKGRLGAQFWSAYTSCKSQFADAVRSTLEQVDVIHRFTNKFSDTFEFAYTAQDVRRIQAEGRIASLIGIEGGHSIDSSVGALRTFFTLGVRYMTLTHTCNLPWADTCTNLDKPVNNLTAFGKDVVLEMNRLGMLVDLSHVSADVMRDALQVTKAPLIFSHSDVFTLCNNSRNVPDDVLDMLKANNGVLMICFFDFFVTCSHEANISSVADHFDYVKNRIGSQYVGVGGDYNGLSSGDGFPTGLEDVSKYPNLMAELIRRGWSDLEIQQAAGLNILRVLEDAEKVAAKLQREKFLPRDEVITRAEVLRVSDLNPDRHANICRVDYD